jgi:hypothetical protein
MFHGYMIRSTDRANMRFYGYGVTLRGFGKHHTHIRLRRRWAPRRFYMMYATGLKAEENIDTHTRHDLFKPMDLIWVFDLKIDV